MSETLQTPENLKLKLIARLRILKTDYRDGIPEETKHSIPREGETKWWKVRKAWFQEVVAELERVLETRNTGGKKLISEESYEKIKIYLKKLYGQKGEGNDSFVERPTTLEDIYEAETVIDEIITELKR